MNRGRGNNRGNKSRGRSFSRGKQRYNNNSPPVDIDFKNPNRQQLQLDKVEETKSILEENKKRSSEARPTPKHIIDSTIEAGKEFVSKYFRGFTDKDRGNIKVEIDDELPERLTEVYQNKIYQMAYDNFKMPGLGTDDENLEESEEEGEIDKTKEMLVKHQRRALKKFCSGISIGMAIKLQHSAPKKEKEKNFNIPLLDRGKFYLPERVSVILNQLGKTDLDGGNKIRVIGQGLAAKRLLIKGIYYHFGHKKLDKYLKNRKHANGLMLRKIMNDPEWFGNMIDDSLEAMEVLKTRAKLKYNELADKNLKAKLKVGSSDVEFNYRLPKITGSDKSEEEVIKLINDPVFNALVFEEKEKDNWAKIISILACFIVEDSWIINSHKKMKELNNKFDSTLIGEFTFDDVLLLMKVWNLEAFFKPGRLSELGGMAADAWITETSWFSRDIKFKEINFSEFGTDAQLVEIRENQMKKVKNHKNFFSRIISGRQIPETKIKISEHGAVLGLASRLTRSVNFRTDFEINFSTENHDILREFLRGDFK